MSQANEGDERQTSGRFVARGPEYGQEVFLGVGVLPRRDRRIQKIRRVVSFPFRPWISSSG